MDPCPFIRLTVCNLALKIPQASKPALSIIHPCSSPCFCKIKLNNFPFQTAAVPYIPPDDDSHPFSLAATFHLSKSDFDRLLAKSVFSGKLQLQISIYTGHCSNTCGLHSRKRLLGKVLVPLDLSGSETRACVFHNGWISVGKSGAKTNTATQFHLNVKADPDPRFVFQFDGEPECSPQVFQIQGNIRQPVFTCKFSFRTPGDRNHRSRSFKLESSSGSKWSMRSPFGGDKQRPIKERKGWSITVHDLSGSPVAAALMVTPFVPSPGSDRVSGSNPGCWLILRPGDGAWEPWARLEAWRERGASDGLGYRLELMPDMSAAGVVLAESTLSSRRGGKFVVDTPGSGNSSACSPRSSGDYGTWPYEGGFVMASSVEGEGKCSKPSVEMSVQHVKCMEDAAAFVALAAAVDLSMDACQLFSQKLRKELVLPEEKELGG
ncbi:hypothetical protein LINGRAHAP2_LOCUS2338 [Linum grandiflorum]